MAEANLLLAGKAQTADPTLVDGSANPLSMTTSGRLRSDVTGTVAVSGGVAVTGAVTVSGTATATPSNGTGYSLTTAATTNANSVKNSAGSLFEISIFNVTGSAVYVKLYNKATAPTVGTDVPIITIPVAAGAVVNLTFGFLGKRFGTGIAIAVTGAAAVSDTTAVGANVLVSATYL